MQVHQLVPGLSVGDAVTNHALEIQQILRELGHESNIYSVSKHVSPHMKSACLDYKEHASKSSKENIALYHFSTGSELTPYFQSLPDKKMMVYHNITPARFFQGLSEEKAKSVEEGRTQLNQLATSSEISLGVSEYNRSELEEAGYKNTGVLPLVIDPPSWDGSINDSLLKQYRDGKTNILFVGRIAPNKKFEDLIRTFYYYQKTVNPNSRLLLVGSHIGMEKYYAFLKALVNELDLKDVVFSGHVSDEDVRTYYQCGDLFLCLSEHEGFCLPLLEAIHVGLPVMAYDACAIGETLGGRGVLIKEKNFLEIAELAGKIMADSALTEQIVAGQKERLNAFTREKVGERLKHYLETLTS